MNTNNYNKVNTKRIHVCSYDSINDVAYAQYLIIVGSNFPISRYINKHVLYAFIIPITTTNNDIIIKIGYSEDIIDRFQTLETEYKSKTLFVKAKIITGKKDETNFHKMIKTKYAELIENYIINGKDKTEYIN